MQSGFPRARGDSRQRGRRPTHYGKVSPRTRGFKEQHHTRPRQPLAFPAHAGIQGSHPAARPRELGFPRACGDSRRFQRLPANTQAPYPRMRGFKQGVMGRDVVVRASPRMRGFKGVDVADLRRAAALPAHAGIQGSRLSHPPTKTSFPRACGDSRITITGTAPAAALSLRMRGFKVVHRQRVQHRAAFPAHVGIQGAYDRTCGNRLCLPRVCGIQGYAAGRLGWRWCFPRECGDSRNHCWQIDASVRLSPRMRGFKAELALGEAARFVFPAHAGIQGTRQTPGSTSRGLPRACRDSRAQGRALDRVFRLSPRMRGFESNWPSTPFCPRAFPAHAGIQG